MTPSEVLRAASLVNRRWRARRTIIACATVIHVSLAGCGAGTSSSTCAVREIAAGANHTCALTAQGGVRCWGAGAEGQLGNGSTEDRAIPSATDALGKVVAISAGIVHTCALTRAGGVRCWGYNGDGQLGDGTTTTRLAPANTDVLTGVKAISAGAAHTCALTLAGGVRCWGRNQAGQLGNGTTTNLALPPVEDVLSGAKAVAAGGSHTCALMATGGVRCWGRNIFGELGNGSGDQWRAVPPAVDAAVADVAMLSLGDAHTCVVLTNGGVRCWGRNADGELGTGSYDSSSVPPSADVLTDARSVAGGLNFTCALLRTGGVRCWGYNSDGQLGDDTELNVDRLLPQPADVLTDATALAVGYGHTCATMTSGGVRCWGANANGQLGDGRAPDPSMFAPATDLATLPDCTSP